ncbi:MAG: RsmE family RNA methyltransferase [Candidatus Omnitrophota bacterium]
MKNDFFKPRTRLFVPAAGEPFLDLRDSESLAVRRTLRLRQGDAAACFNGDGREYEYGVESSTPSSLLLRLEDSHPNPRDAFPECSVFIAATKGKTKDRIARDLPPLGATRIVFYRAARSICRMKDDPEGRLQKIAIEACRQCGRSTIPRVVVEDASISDFFKKEKWPPDRVVFFWEEAKSIPPFRIPGDDSPLFIIFGPEGGFSPEEADFARRQGFQFGALGSRILRTELAAVAGLVLAQAQRNLFSAVA